MYINQIFFKGVINDRKLINFNSQNEKFYNNGLKILNQAIKKNNS